MYSLLFKITFGIFALATLLLLPVAIGRPEFILPSLLAPVVVAAGFAFVMGVLKLAALAERKDAERAARKYAA